jgi:hypothetical protein
MNQIKTPGTFLAVILALFLFGVCPAQQNPSKPGKTETSPPASNPLKSSAAYAEVILRQTELEADLESMLVEFTEEYPKVKEARYELEFLQVEFDRLTAVKPADAGKLTAALGKLMVRKAGLAADLKALRAQYDDKHPDVMSAKKKVDVFEKAIKDILGL